LNEAWLWNVVLLFLDPIVEQILEESGAHLTLLSHLFLLSFHPQQVLSLENLHVCGVQRGELVFDFHDCVARGLDDKQMVQHVDPCCCAKMTKLMDSPS